MMRRLATLPFVLLVGGLPGCGAGASRGDDAAAELQAWSAQTEAMREHARLLEVEARLREMEHRLAARPGVCEGTSDPTTVEVAGAREHPRAAPLRSEGDFQAEARLVTQAAAAPPPATVAVAATQKPATPASERARLDQLLDGLREYASDPQSGLSPERREALRVLLRRDRKLDLMNPWTDH